MASHNILGQWGEEQAALYMERNGWFVRHRDWRCGHVDIDLVCIDAEATLLVFVEVKTRSSDAFGQPYEAVDSEKRRHIVDAANSYRCQNHLENLEVRYDIISIVGSSIDSMKLEHRENAFSLIDVFEDYNLTRKKRYYK